MLEANFALMIAIAIVVLYLLNSIKILRDYERAVIFRLGRALPGRKGLALFSFFVRSTRWFASPCARKCWKFRRRI